MQQDDRACKGDKGGMRVRWGYLVDWGEGVALAWSGRKGLPDVNLIRRVRLVASGSFLWKRMQLFYCIFTLNFHIGLSYINIACIKARTLRVIKTS